MRMDPTIRGAAAVGQISEVSVWEAELILNLRLWQDGESGQQAVWNAYACALGTAEGREALNRFAGLVATIEAHMLRPFMRHGVACGCICSDEAVFANMVSLAAMGELHEATLIATLIVRASHAEMVALMAGDVGCSVQKLVERRRPMRDRLDGRRVTRPKQIH